MRKSLKIACFFLLFPLGGVFASSCDSLIFETDNLKMFFCEKKQDYLWLDKKTNETVKHLKFVHQLGGEFQVLDRENQLFYIDENGKRSEESIYRNVDFGSWALVVLSVVTTDSTFEVHKGQITNDLANQALTRIETISKADADSVSFLNGQMEFQFKRNFEYTNFFIDDARVLILMKNGQYFTAHHPDLKYDAIEYSPEKGLLLTQKGALFGILDVVEPKYTDISKPDFFLTKVTLPNGERKYIDTEGREY